MILVHQALLALMLANWPRWCTVAGLPAAQALLWQPLAVQAHLIAMIRPSACWAG